MELEYKIIGNRIKLRRKEMNMKQAELAKKLNISNNHMSSIENGSQKPSLALFAEICDTLNVTPDFLLLGAMHAYNTPLNIVDQLRRCSQEDVDFIMEFIEMFINRKTKEATF